MTVITILNDLINQASINDASDIHIDPEEKQISIKFRVDGRLHVHSLLEKRIHQELIGRIKVLARLRTDEHYLPQDGRFKYQQNNQDYDIRVSILPSYYGENAVLRLLRKTRSDHSIADLGLTKENEEKINRVLKKRSGMIIITGPTGSGKTTTLYSCIKALSHDKLVVTIEDPIEYAIEGIRQIQVGLHKGLTFAHGLRSILRQDPDVIMVGEIRDSETAHIAVHAALTGHLLLTTMHTTDAASALPRLFDMKIDPYLIASTVDIVIAQRLVRKICVVCKGEGCKECFESGFKGRVGIYEILEMTDEIKDLVLQNSGTELIKKKAKEQGMLTMLDDGKALSDLGSTTWQEVQSTLS